MECNAQLLEALLPNATIRQIAATIRGAWLNPYFGAKPYIEAMQSLDNITEDYYQDPGSEIVAYFLANATRWHGETARLIKKELNRRLKET